jgi:hypothetical protein
MKKPNRQTLLIAGAIICLLISIFALLPRGSGSAGDQPVLSENAAAPPPTEPSDGATGSDPAAASAPPLNPEFYQRVRQQLLAVTPEHQEPFAAEGVPVSSTKEVGGAIPTPARQVGQETATLPVLPLTLQPASSDQEPVQHSKGEEGNGESGFTASLPVSTNSPRFRGRIYDHAKGQIVVLFELNGVLLRATNEPNAEWRIVRNAPRQITVRHGEQTLILEVPYAP